MYYNIIFKKLVKKKLRQQCAAVIQKLLLAEGHTISALILTGICLVSTNQNTIQRAIVLAAAVVGALLNSTFDALICIAVHISIPPSSDDRLIISTLQKIKRKMCGISIGAIDNLTLNLYNISGKCEFSGISLRKTENSS